jgi:hypothetical protein
MGAAVFTVSEVGILAGMADTVDTVDMAEAVDTVGTAEAVGMADAKRGR